MSRSVLAIMASIARAHARERRRIEAAQRRADAAEVRRLQAAARVRKAEERETVRTQKAAERSDREREKEDRRQDERGRAEEAERLTLALDERVTELEAILETTLQVDDAIDFASLRMDEDTAPTPAPVELATEAARPLESEYVSRVRKTPIIDSML